MIVRFGIAISMLTFFGCSPALDSQPVPQHHSAYAEHDRTTALSAEEMADLRSGTGMGMARPAELNGYPGPRHSLELANELGLTPEQIARTREVFELMRSDAVELGEVIIDKEAYLTRRFAHSHIDDAALEALTLEIGKLRADLRFVHLSAHLRMKEILTSDQISRYDQLRGYSDGVSTTHMHSH